MPAATDIAPRISPDVVIRPMDDGRSVVKNTSKSSFMKMGEQESFLLAQLDGTATYDSIVEAFEQRFDDPLSCDDLHGFISMVKKEGLIDGSGRSSKSREEKPADKNALELGRQFYAKAKKQNLFYFRVKLFNPDRLLNWLEPKTRWLFSPQLAVAAVVAGVAALLLTIANRSELITLFTSQLGWETFVLAWFTAVAVTICHEFGHGLACKRFGGEVNEMGALWIFFMPCLFCNVSDAWMLSSRWQRLLVSMAGTYVDFLIWIVAVFVWRLTAADTSINYMSWIVVTTCGLRVLFNINPLMRMDGYYALSDLLGVHNLRKRGRQRWLSYVRWALWGGKWPEKTVDGRALLIYGSICWLFTVVFLNLLFFQVASFLQSFMGLAGIVGGAAIFIKFSKRYFQGSLGEDFKKMFTTRKKRVLIWAAGVLVILIVPIYDRAGGPFKVRPVIRREVRAPVAGFLREVTLDEGDHLPAGFVFARIEVPELKSEITRKQAEIHEAEAKLRRLEAGARPEQIAAQQESIERAINWRDLAKRDLEHAKMSLQEELAQLDLQIAQARSEWEYRDAYYVQARQLFEKGGLAGQQLLAERKRVQEAASELQQAEAKKRARIADGVLRYESELARREKDLADIRSDLTMLEAGSRPEDIEAERASLLRLREEMNHLKLTESKQVIACPVSGTITTPRLKEKIGEFLPRGTVICVVEDLVNLEAEIAVSEQDARVLVPGQPVTLKPRAMPLCRLKGKVDRVAPAAQNAENAAQSTVTVYCQVENKDGALRTGMTGFGRIDHKRRPLGLIVLGCGLRLMRTEFWW